MVQFENLTWQHTGAAPGEEALPILGSVANAAGNTFAGMAAEAAVERATAAGALLARGAAVLRSGLGKLVIGTIVNIIWDAIGSLLEKTNEREEAQDDAARRVGDAAEAMFRMIEARTRAEVCRLLLEEQEAYAALETIDDPLSLNDLTAAFRKARVPDLDLGTDLSLYRELMVRWRLQYAATPDKPRREPVGNAQSWYRAPARVAEADNKYRTSSTPAHQEALGESITKPDLYVDQCQLEWSRYGLDPDPAIASLRAAMKRPTHGRDGLGVPDWHWVFTRADDNDLLERRIWQQHNGSLVKRLGTDIGDRQLQVRVDLRGGCDGEPVYVKRFRFEILSSMRPTGADWDYAP